MSFDSTSVDLVSYEWREITLDPSATQIQNKGVNGVLLLNSVTQPAADSDEGFLLVQYGRPGSSVALPDTTTLWGRAIRSTSTVYSW